MNNSDFLKAAMNFLHTFCHRILFVKQFFSLFSFSFIFAILFCSFSAFEFEHMNVNMNTVSSLFNVSDAESFWRQKKNIWSRKILRENKKENENCEPQHSLVNEQVRKREGKRCKKFYFWGDLKWMSELLFTRIAHSLFPLFCLLHTLVSYSHLNCPLSPSIYVSFVSLFHLRC